MYGSVCSVALIRLIKNAQERAGRWVSKEVQAR